MPRGAPRGGLVLAAASFSLLVPASADALTVELSGTSLKVSGAGTEANRVTVATRPASSP